MAAKGGWSAIRSPTSDHRRFFVLVLVVFVFVVIIVIGVSRRHRVALAGDEAPPRQALPPARLELGLRGLTRRRVRLSMELRASEDRTHQLRSENELLRERAVSAERWLLTNQKEIEEKLIAPRSF
jgi:hypothetical protein